MDGINELAKMLRERDNKQTMDNVQLGRVISLPPNIKVQMDNKIIIGKDRLLISSYVLSGYAYTLEIGDKVALIPYDNDQKYLLVDKVVQL